MRKNKWFLMAAALMTAAALAGCAGPEHSPIGAATSQDEVISSVPETLGNKTASTKTAVQDAATSADSKAVESAAGTDSNAVAESTATADSKAAAESAAATDSKAAAESAAATDSTAATESAASTLSAAPIDPVVSSASSAESAASSEASAPATPTPDPDEGFKIIGTKDQSASAWRVPVKNETFSGLVYLSIKNADDEEYPGNFFPEGVRLDHDEEGVLYFTFKDATALYNVKVQFDDGSYHYMTALPFPDMESARILYEDNTLFMIYKSKESGEEVSTKETELEWQGLLRGDVTSQASQE